MPQPEAVLGPARRLGRAWARTEPVEPHTPVPRVVALSVFSAFITSGDHAAAVIVSLCFHCLVRVEEAMHLRWGDLSPAPTAFQDAYPHVAGLVTIRRPKLRTGVGRYKHQFAIVEERRLAQYYSWLTADLSARDTAQPIWPGGGHPLPRVLASGTAALGAGRPEPHPLRLEARRCDAPFLGCLLYTSPSPRDLSTSRMPSSA